MDIQLIDLPNGICWDLQRSGPRRRMIFFTKNYATLITGDETTAVDLRTFEEFSIPKFNKLNTCALYKSNWLVSFRVDAYRSVVFINIVIYDLALRAVVWSGNYSVDYPGVLNAAGDVAAFDYIISPLDDPSVFVQLLNRSGTIWSGVFNARTRELTELGQYAMPEQRYAESGHIHPASTEDLNLVLLEYLSPVFTDFRCWVRPTASNKYYAHKMIVPISRDPNYGFILPAINFDFVHLFGYFGWMRIRKYVFADYMFRAGPVVSISELMKLPDTEIKYCSRLPPGVLMAIRALSDDQLRIHYKVFNVDSARPWQAVYTYSWRPDTSFIEAEVIDVDHICTGRCSGYVIV